MATRKIAKKKPTAKTAKKLTVVKPTAKKPKKVIKRVPPRIIKKTQPVRPEEEFTPIDTAKAVAFGMDIVRQMKAERVLAEQQAKKEEAIRLARRPTTRMQGKTTAKFPAADLREFKRRLILARTEAIAGVHAMKETSFNDSEDHEADGGDGTAQTLRLQALGQVGNINRTIQQIDEALHRISDGTYGVCTICGQLIRKPRLMNQPFVQTCMECQNEMERERTAK